MTEKAVQPDTDTDTDANANAHASASAFTLLVEDNPADAGLTQALLDAATPGALAPLRWVQSAEAAVAMLEHSSGCVCVLLDLGLPGSSGLDALRDVIAAAPLLPVIVLTGDDSIAVGVRAMHSGAQDYLVKGQIDAASLTRAVAFATQRKQAELQRFALSLHDELTGLPRRGLLRDRLQLAMTQTGHGGSRGALLFIDLDGFKTINDQHGHAIGDAVLTAIGQRLQTCVRVGDTVGRIGGDEFVVLLVALAAHDDSRVVGQKLLAAIERPIVLGGLELRLSASIGIRQFEGTATAADALLAAADAAMYSAKAAGKGRVVDSERG